MENDFKNIIVIVKWSKILSQNEKHDNFIYIQLFKMTICSCGEILDS